MVILQNITEYPLVRSRTLFSIFLIFWIKARELIEYSGMFWNNLELTEIFLKNSASF